MNKKINIEKLIIILNLIFYRVDTLINNVMEISLIVGFKALIDMSLGYSVPTIQILIIPFYVHFIYMIVYIINDFIDIHMNHSKKVNETFYSLRPMYYFNNIRYILLYFMLIYLLYVFLLIHFIDLMALFLVFYIVLLVVFSIAHSYIWGIYRVFTFLTLRFLRYILALVVYNILIFKLFFDLSTILVIIFLIIPFLIYSLFQYSKTLGLVLEFRLIILFSFVFFAFILIIINVSFAMYFKPLLLCYILPVSLVGVRKLLHIIFGKEDYSFYRYLIRLIAGMFFTLLVVFGFILLVKLGMYACGL